MANVHNASAVAQRALNEAQTGFLTEDNLYAVRVMADALTYIASQGLANRKTWHPITERFDRAFWQEALARDSPQAE